MRISFDVDGTLILPDEPDAAPVEALPRWRSWLIRERLRRGTRALLTQLARQGHEIWIYTSSMRSRWSIRWLFLLHGIRLHGIVNFTAHERGVLRSGLEHAPSKYPPAFGIDLHIDDSIGVAAEGADHGFAVAVISADDRAWEETVLGLIARVYGNASAQHTEGRGHHYGDQWRD